MNNNVGKDYKGIKVSTSLKNIQKEIKKNEIKEVIIALEKEEKNEIIDVISKCDINGLIIKIVPDLYEIISGRVKTYQISGYPLIEVMPELMPDWEKKAKRLMDFVVSLTIIFFTLPITILVAIAIKVDSKGPIFYKQLRTGKKGKLFYVIKFRSMIQRC